MAKVAACRDDEWPVQKYLMFSITYLVYKNIYQCYFRDESDTRQEALIVSQACDEGSTPFRRLPFRTL